MNEIIIILVLLLLILIEIKNKPPHATKLVAVYFH